ncbi:hypothetical protein PO909_003124 [Leuciscus waleckii]
MEVPSHARHLLLQLNTQRTKGFLCDVIIVVQNALFRAHKNILAASSLYLKSLVVHDNLINLDHEMVSPGVFRVILDYIYTGRLSEGDPTSPTEPNIGAVLAAASYLQLLDLVTLCKKKLKRNGKYHLRPNPGFLPYKIDPSGMGGRRFRISPPVIHSVMSTPRPTPLENNEEKMNMSERGYDRGTCDDAEDENGTGSEETGSSEGRPSPSGPGGRYHMPYEPESFGDNLYVCIPCDKGFPSSEQLNAHVETHNEEELNNGSEVDNNNPATLRQHEKTHWLTRPYPCSICGKKFTQRGTMTRHMRSHLGLKPFACDACGMRFTRQYRLTEHMRIHSGEKPYECQVCGGKFAQQRNLISHMKMHSSGGAGGGLTPDGKLKMDFSEGIYPLSKYAAEHLGLKQEKTSDLFAASQHLLADAKVMESLYPLSKLAVEHLGLTHNKMDILNPSLPPTSQQLSAESRTIDRYSPS